MSYATKIDEMIGQYVAEYQAELSLAKEIKECLDKPIMPYGYPVAVYSPKHICKAPNIKDFISKTGGHLSNEVPRILGMEIVEDYPLGIYNQRK